MVISKLFGVQMLSLSIFGPGMLTYEQNAYLYAKGLPRPLVKSVYGKITFLNSQPKHMLWVLKRTVSIRRSFEYPQHMLKHDGYENIQFHA